MSEERHLSSEYPTPITTTFQIMEAQRWGAPFFVAYRIIDHIEERVYNVGWNLHDNWIDEDTIISTFSHECIEALIISLGIEDDLDYDIHNLIGRSSEYYGSLFLDENTVHILEREHYIGNKDGLPNIPDHLFRKKV